MNKDYMSETIESSKAFDEKFGIWNFNEYDSTELFVMQVIRNAYQID